MGYRWLYAALVVVATVLLVSTGSFSATSADRDVDVTVADDGAAFVGYDATCTNGTLSITIANRFDSPISGTVVADDMAADLGPITPGAQSTLTINSTTPGAAVTATINGPETSVELERSAPETC